MGAPGLAFETWDPSNQFTLETPTLLFVIRSVADLSRLPRRAVGPAVEGSAVQRAFRRDTEFYPQTKFSSRLPRPALGPW
jgi:hypothetical protein